MDIKVGIIMGSDSDLPVMSKAAEILDEPVSYTHLDTGYLQPLAGCGRDGKSCKTRPIYICLQ